MATAAGVTGVCVNDFLPPDPLSDQAQYVENPGKPRRWLGFRRGRTPLPKEENFFLPIKRCSRIVSLPFEES